MRRAVTSAWLGGRAWWDVELVRVVVWTLLAAVVLTLLVITILTPGTPSALYHQAKPPATRQPGCWPVGGRTSC